MDSILVRMRIQVIRELSDELENWMIDQGDILITHGPMPLLKSRANPLDVKTKYNRIPDSLVNTLNNQDYLNLHL